MDIPAYEKKLIENIIISIKKYGGENCLSSIILTGSFGRGEPTYIIETNGSLRLKSDVEIALIFPQLSQKKNVELLVQKVSSEFEEDLNLMPINERRVCKACNFNFSLKVPKYKTIFTYDLFNGSKTIWGRDFIGERTITLADVDPYEAKRLVANRIGELAYLQKVQKMDEKDYLRKQWKGKLILAIVSAWLICEKKYVSSYYGQYDSLKQNIDKIEKLLGKDFFCEYDKVFSFLRRNGETYEIPDHILVGYVKKMDQYFTAKDLKSSKVNSGSRWIKYSLKYLRTGIGYGVVGFENRILQALIEDYWNQSERLSVDADVWYRVLY